MIWPFRRKTTTETGAQYYVRDAAVADAKAVVDFKHRAWRSMYGQLKDEDFFAQAHATTDEQVKFWQSRITKGDKIWIAEDLRDRMIGTIHATSTHSDVTAEFLATHSLGELREIRFFYLAESATTAVGRALIDQAVGENPAITWVSGTAPLAVESLSAAGFRPVGEPLESSVAPWQGVSRQAMVRT